MRTVRHRLLGVLLALGLAAALSACGSGKHPSDATAENNGYYVSLGGISYQLQVSRELNRFSVEDHQYLVGLPNNPPTPDQIWYGVFLRAINGGHQTQAVSDTFDITDTQGNVYHPVALPSINQFAWTGTTLAPLQTEPAPDTTAYNGPTQGGLILFKLPTTVYANRPLTLRIHGSANDLATISLDL